MPRLSSSSSRRKQNGGGICGRYVFWIYSIPVWMLFYGGVIFTWVFPKLRIEQQALEEVAAQAFGLHAAKSAADDKRRPPPPQQQYHHDQPTATNVSRLQEHHLLRFRTTTTTTDTSYVSQNNHNKSSIHSQTGGGGSSSWIRWNVSEIQAYAATIPERHSCVVVPPVTFLPNEQQQQQPACWLERVGMFLERPHCHFEDLRIHPSRVYSKNRGGESVEAVWGQPESDEYLQYQPGAFQSAVLPRTSSGDEPNNMSLLKRMGNSRNLHYVSDVLQTWEPLLGNNDATTNATTCSKMIPGLTLFIQRYEYANIFHTSTDWFNTWTEMDAFQRDFPHVPFTGVVFLDAHPSGALDSVWTRLFHHATYIGHLWNTTNEKTTTTDGPIAFEHALLVPAGYNCEVYLGTATNHYCPNPPQMKAFVDFFLHAMQLKNVAKVPNSLCILDRKPYKAHPRKDMNAIQRVVSNWPEVMAAIQSNMMTNHTSSPGRGLHSMHLYALETMSIEEQVRRIRQCHILLGNHGAGLTHLLWMHDDDDDDTHVLEFQHSNGKMFPAMADWKPGVHHHMLSPVRGSVVTQQVIQGQILPLLQQILYPS